MKNQKKKFSCINLGCRVNLFESTAIIDQMIKNGFKFTKDYKKSNICIINTCTVTSRADSKCRNMINRARKYAKVLVIIGCYSQINSEYSTLHGDIILGNKFKKQLPKLINAFYKHKRQIVKVNNLSHEKEFEEFPVYSFCENTRAVIKIQDGCDFMCSYCLIPYARGRQRSLSHTKVLKTIKSLVSKNFYEIVLTGVNTAGYKDKNYTFYDLLKDIDKLYGNFRVRISSIEPFQINKQIIDLITKNKSRWVQEFHLCLQSANDKILKSMNRKYTINQFYELCKYIRIKNPLASITTDYIVGYNNETDQIFKECVKNLKKINFSFINIFPYSVRKNTRGSFESNQIDTKTKFLRVKKISELANKCTKNYLNNFINKKVKVWFENSNLKNIQVGHSQYFFKVYVKTKKKLHNQLYDVLINRNVDNKLFGRLVSSIQTKTNY